MSLGQSINGLAYRPEARRGDTDDSFVVRLNAQENFDLFGWYGVEMLGPRDCICGLDDGYRAASKEGPEFLKFTICKAKSFDGTMFSYLTSD